VSTSPDAIQAERQLLQILAEFRYRLRSFLQFSERVASQIKLQPQQHQLLLQVAGAPERTKTTIAYAAERLALRHHSTVELVNRSVAQGLLLRTRDPQDRRRVVLRMTARGRRLLKQLSLVHAQELRQLGPHLVSSLKRIQRADRSRTQRRAR
jgi:DNA-binding MarR family transcriptional regulator